MFVGSLTENMTVSFRSGSETLIAPTKHPIELFSPSVVDDKEIDTGASFIGVTLTLNVSKADNCGSVFVSVAVTVIVVLPFALDMYVNVRILLVIEAVTKLVLLLITDNSNVSESTSENKLDRFIVVGSASSSTVTSPIGFITVGVSFIGFTVTLNTSSTDNAGSVDVSVAVTFTVVFPLACSSNTKVTMLLEIEAFTKSVLLLVTVISKVCDSISVNTLLISIVVALASSSTTTSSIGFNIVGTSFTALTVTIKVSDELNGGLVLVSVAVTVTAVLPLALATYVKFKSLPDMATVTISVSLLTAVMLKVSDSTSVKTPDKSIVVGPASSVTVTSEIGLSIAGVSFSALTVMVNAVDTERAGTVDCSVALTTIVVLPLAFATNDKLRDVPSTEAVTKLVLLLTAERMRVSESTSLKTFAMFIVVSWASSFTVKSFMLFATVGVSLIAFIVTEKVSEMDNAGLVPVSVAVTTTVVLPLAFAT